MTKFSSYRCALLVLVGLVANSAEAAITLIGAGSIPGSARDQSGLSGILEDGVTPRDQIGGLGSALAYSGTGDIYYAAPDRGPADGASTYEDRLYRLKITLKQNGAYGTNAYTVTPKVLSTRLLKNEKGAVLTGSSEAFDATHSPASRRFDPEGLRVGACSSEIYISDEYGPSLYRFNRSGRRAEVISLPRKFGIDAPSANAAEELSGNAFGRQANRGMEGLAISPDGRKLYGLMQNALLQDGALDSTNARVATNTRLLEIDRATGEIREFLYRLDDSSLGVNEIVAINATQFLVIERDGRAGTAAAFKKIMKIDIASATDIRNIKSLPATGLPANVVPVSKTLFLDLLNPAYGLAGRNFPEKIEGLAFGPTLEGGQYSLVVSSDNDFKSDTPSRFYVFGIDSADLPGYQPQRIRNCSAGEPEPEEPDPSTVSFAELFDTVFAPDCGTCHSGTDPGRLPRSLNLRDRAAAYAALVNVQSVQQPSYLRVNPGRPDESYLVRKVIGDSNITGVRMPAGEAELSAETIERIKTWIREGAKNN